MSVQTTSEKALRKQLQQHFKSDMNEKKAFIKEHVSRAAAAAAPAPRQHCLPGWLWTRVSQLFGPVSQQQNYHPAATRAHNQDSVVLHCNVCTGSVSNVPCQSMPDPAGQCSVKG
jgi:hypothetical protein